MKTSHGTIPAGLTLYTFEYPPGHVSKETWCCGEDDECIPNPPQCFIESNVEAVKFGDRFGASRITNAVTGKIVSSRYF
jgi:hypothetical protein